MFNRTAPLVQFNTAFLARPTTINVVPSEGRNPPQGSAALGAVKPHIIDAPHTAPADCVAQYQPAEKYHNPNTHPKTDGHG